MNAKKRQKNENHELSTSTKVKTELGKNFSKVQKNQATKDSQWYCLAMTAGKEMLGIKKSRKFFGHL